MFKLRHVVGLLGSAAITAGLFLFMMALVATEKQTEEIEETDPIIIGRTIDDTETEVKKRIPERPIAEEKPPKPPVMKTKVEVENDVSPGKGFGLGGFKPDITGVGSRDSRAIPLVPVPPQYPERCRSKGIEGQVLLEFDITETGTVENVRVIESQPGTCFVKASVRAIQKWKYRPKTVNGKAVPQFGAQELIVYEFEDDA